MGLSLIPMWHLSGRIWSWKMCCVAGWGTINGNVKSRVKERIAVLVLVLSLFTERKRLTNQPAKTKKTPNKYPTEPFLFKVQNNDLIIYWGVFFSVLGNIDSNHEEAGHVTSRFPSKPSASLLLSHNMEVICESKVEILSSLGGYLSRTHGRRTPFKGVASPLSLSSQSWGQLRFCV